MDIQALAIYVADYLNANWTTILAYLAAGGGISVAIEFLKRLRGWQRSAWIQSVLAVFSAAAATADWLINNLATSPLSAIFGDMGPKIMVAAILMHRIAINPITKAAEKGLRNWVAKQGAEAAASVTVTGSITPKPGVDLLPPSAESDF